MDFTVPAGFLFGVEPTDPLSLGAAAVALAVAVERDLLPASLARRRYGPGCSLRSD
jgi:hypothetical protein